MHESDQSSKNKDSVPRPLLVNDGEICQEDHLKLEKENGMVLMKTFSELFCLNFSPRNHAAGDLIRH